MGKHIYYIPCLFKSKPKMSDIDCPHYLSETKNHYNRLLINKKKMAELEVLKTDLVDCLKSKKGTEPHLIAIEQWVSDNSPRKSSKSMNQGLGEIMLEAVFQKDL